MPQPISTLLAGEWVTISFQSYCGLIDTKNKPLEIKRISNEEVAFDIFEYLKPIMNTTESNGNTNIFIAKE